MFYSSYFYLGFVGNFGNTLTMFDASLSIKAPIFSISLQKVPRHKSRKDENVITYIYPLKRNKNINYIILNRSQRICARVCVRACDCVNENE